MGGPRVQLARALSNLAITYYLTDRDDEAQALEREALEIRQRVLGPEHPDTLISMQSLGAQLRHVGRLDEAEPLLVTVVETLRRTLGPDSSNLGAPLTNLAALMSDRGDLDGAAEIFQEAIRVHRAGFPADHPNQAFPVVGLAIVRERQELYPEALTLYEDALEIRRSAFGDDHWRSLQTQASVGFCRLQLGDREGLELLLESHEGLSDSLGPEAGATRSVADRLVRAYELLGDSESAARYREVSP
jgi:tetratricopeptide (TPR) repeat protein